MKTNKHKTPVIPAADKVLETEFSHEAPEAKEVFLAGSFNDWNVTDLPMSRDPQGVWRVWVPLAPGHYENTGSSRTTFGMTIPVRVLTCPTSLAGATAWWWCNPPQNERSALSRWKARSR